MTKYKLLAIDIYEWCKKYDLWGDNTIYFDGKAWSNSETWGGVKGKKIDDDLYEYEDKDPCDYFEYGNPDTLSMSFEGGLYDVLNYSGGSKEDKFMKIFEKCGLYYELGNAWNLSCYLINDDIEVEYTYYKKPKETVYLRRSNYSTPSELQNIMDIWYDLSKKEGNKGSCVLGAGFNFEWQDDDYFMPACSPWQGSISWEAHKDTIEKMLEDIGATEIYYNWGRMD